MLSATAYIYGFEQEKECYQEIVEIIIQGHYNTISGYGYMSL
jgi:hypothetical protein